MDVRSIYIVEFRSICRACNMKLYRTKKIKVDHKQLALGPTRELVNVLIHFGHRPVRVDGLNGKARYLVPSVAFVCQFLIAV